MLCSVIYHLLRSNVYDEIIELGLWKFGKDLSVLTNDSFDCVGDDSVLQSRFISLNSVESV